jgi:uncharacterized protein (TIGR02996 family)
MAVESQFLAEIAARPEDRSARLVYADFLEERGDARAELIRVEEEMRRVAIYTDRYWELKPRRNALRAKCREGWLGQMQYGTDYEPVFREVPDGWKERWRLLREFTERWHRIEMPDVGGRTKEVKKIEKTLKLKLPPAVREWVGFSLDLLGQSRFEDVLRDCFEVKILDDLGALSLMIQGEGDMYWAIKLEHLQAPDPPVELFSLDYGHGDPRFVPYCHFATHVTSFVFRHMMVYLGLAGRGSIQKGNVDLTPRTRRRLAKEFSPPCLFDGVKVFEKQNTIAVLGHEPWAKKARLKIASW